MPILNTYIDDEEIRAQDEESDQEQIDRETILAMPTKEIQKKVEDIFPATQNRNSFAQEMEAQGLDNSSIAYTLKEILVSSSKDANRLKAAELAMKAKGLFDIQRDNGLHVQFNIAGDNVKVAGILMPQRS